MADTNDTIDGLLAEFRGYSAGMPPSYHVTMSWADFRRMLDRIDAAHDHDIATATEASARAVVGACVKQQEAERKCVALREALRECAQYIACVGGIGVGKVTINDNVHLIPEELVQKAITALDATEKEGGANG